MQVEIKDEKQFLINIKNQKARGEFYFYIRFQYHQQL